MVLGAERPRGGPVPALLVLLLVLGGLIGWDVTYVVNFSVDAAAPVPAEVFDGLQIGMQPIGRRYSDADVLAASATYERLRPWHDAYARCADRPLP